MLQLIAKIIQASVALKLFVDKSNVALCTLFIPVCRTSRF